MKRANGTGRQIVLLLAVACLCLLPGCDHHAEQEETPIQLVEDDSFFSEFAVDEETNCVTLDCYLTFYNDTTQAQSFSVAANFQADEGRGLLKSGKLTGMLRETGEAIFDLAAGERRGEYVRFVGEYGGYPQKESRDLPEEIIIQVGESEFCWQRSY